MISKKIGGESLRARQPAHGSERERGSERDRSCVNAIVRAERTETERADPSAGKPIAEAESECPRVSAN